MTKIQGQFRPRKRQYFEKRFLPAYSTGFKVPETRVDKKNYSFKTLLDGPLLRFVGFRHGRVSEMLWPATRTP